MKLKRTLRWLIPVLILSLLLQWGFVRTCVYRHITHMTDDELAWITNRHNGEAMHFKSANGAIDTIEIRGIIVQNSLDPINWSAFNIESNGHYTASAQLCVVIRDKVQLFEIFKWSNDSTISFSLPYMGIHKAPLNVTNMHIADRTLNDVMVFNNATPANKEPDNCNKILSMAWSKEYGLVQYTLADGTVYNRIGLTMKI